MKIQYTPMKRLLQLGISSFLLFLGSQCQAQWNVEIGNTSLKNDGGIYFNPKYAYFQVGYNVKNWNFGAFVFNRDLNHFIIGSGLSFEYSFVNKKMKRWELLALNQYYFQKSKISFTNKGPLYYAAGIGLGIGFKINEHFSVNTKSVFGAGFYRLRILLLKDLKVLLLFIYR